MISAVALCLVVVVHDGDSLRCDGEKVRVVNIDAPELAGSVRCKRPPKSTKNPPWCDAALGLSARDALRAFVLRGPVQIRRVDRDRYGRTLARVTVNGQDAGAYLVGRGLARWWKD